MRPLIRKDLQKQHVEELQWTKAAPDGIWDILFTDEYGHEHHLEGLKVVSSDEWEMHVKWDE